MKKTDWTDELRKKMASQEEPADDSLWAGIEQALDGQPAPSVPVRKVMWRRWMAAAAVVLAFVGGSIVWLGRHGEESVAGLKMPEKVAERQQQWRQMLPSAPVNDLPTLAMGRVRPAVSPLLEDEKTVNISPEGVESTAENDLPSTPEAPTTERPTSSKEEKSAPQPIAEADLVDALSGSLSSFRSQKVALGLYAANGLGNYSRADRVAMSPEMHRQYSPSQAPRRLMSRAATANDEGPVYLVGYGEKAHHELPLSVGLTVSVPFADRWSLTTGFVYTRLNATFTQQLQRHTIESQQRLHYVGLPMSVNYSFVRSKRLSVYASAGAEVDVNVRATTETEGVSQPMKKDRPQFSATAGLGAVYHLTPMVGLYVEPQLRYSLKNGSSVQTYFKEKPFNPSLQVGLRVEVK